MIEPGLAFALRELSWLRDRELPMLAAHWLAQGLDGPTLRELAGMTPGDLSAAGDSLWREALADAGVVCSAVPVRERAAPYLARIVIEGKLTERRLCEFLWPWQAGDGESEEPAMAALVYGWDELLDYRERLTRRPDAEAAPDLRRLGAVSATALAALADGDIAGAQAAITAETEA